jgi:hypothetical protein
MAEAKATAEQASKKVAAKPATKKVPKEEIMQKHTQMI